MADQMDSTEARLMDVRLSAIASDLTDVKRYLEKVSEALTQLAVIDQRLNAHSESISRAFKELEDHEERIVQIERAAPAIEALHQSRKDSRGRVLEIITIILGFGAVAWLSHVLHWVN